MKMRILAAGLIAASALYSCTEKTAETTSTDSLGVAASYKIATEGSVVRWEGNNSGVAVYSHFGNINLIEGALDLKGTTITGGSFVVDMKSITPMDSAYSAEHPKEHLIGHLSNKDFFLVDSFPTAKFVIKSVEGNVATGDLTVRGTTNEEKVTDIAVDTTGGVVTATGKLVFNRQKYGVAWKNPAKDMILADDVKLDIKLVGNKQ
ncbi:MAG: YceI family protein [Cytophagaceae bacterium]|jgi:polyisoprenoid-binding protein YceI|nr:YceI family protein [Cytophagaceae bacterium]